jgi:hypothetical protein
MQENTGKKKVERKVCCGAVWPTADLARSHPGLNLKVHSEKPAAIHLNCDTALTADYLYLCTFPYNICCSVIYIFFI